MAILLTVIGYWFIQIHQWANSPNTPDPVKPNMLYDIRIFARNDHIQFISQPKNVLTSKHQSRKASEKE